MVLTGYARVLRGNLTPNQIIDAEPAASGDPALLAAACLAQVDPTFAERVREGDVLVLSGDLIDGEGSEAAVIALQSVGVAATLCGTATPAFVALTAVYGLPLIVAPEACQAIAEGTLVRLDLARGRLDANGNTWTFAPLPRETIAATNRAQLLTRMRRVVEDEGYAE